MTVMPSEPTSRDEHSAPAVALSDLPRDELVRYGRGLGLEFPHDAERQDVILQIRRRQEMLIELDREALLDIVVWARRPVRKEAGKEELAREIVQIQETDYHRLSRRGLTALARLRGIEVQEGGDADAMVDRLRKNDGWWKQLARKRRALMAVVVEKLVEKHGGEQAGEYRFLPDEAPPSEKLPAESLRKQIEDHGLVGGLASRIRGAADDYVRLKLDEIEARIDAKLDQIDRRLADWRDREVANRLRILRITLMFTVLVALLSLGYNIIKARVAPTEKPPPNQTMTH